MTNRTEPTKETIAVGAFLSAMHDQGLDGAKVREAMLDVLVLSATLQAREGEAVANSAILARGRFHFFKGEDGEPDDWEWFEEGTNCEHGCIDAVIVRADAIAAPQPAQPSEPAQLEQVERSAFTEWWGSQPDDSPTYQATFAAGYRAALQSAQPVEASQPKLFVGTDMQDGVLTVSVLQREPDGVAVLVHHEEITVSAQPVALPMADVAKNATLEAELATLHANGAKAWAGVDPQELRTGMTPLSQPDKQRLWNDARHNNPQAIEDAAMEYGTLVEAAHGIGGAL